MKLLKERLQEIIDKEMPMSLIPTVVYHEKDVLSIALQSYQLDREWINVEERLPNEMKKVLLYNTLSREIAIGYYWGIDEDYDLPVFYAGDFKFRATHFQYLPQPPQTV